MEFRYPHYLRPAGKGRWPTIVLCVSASSLPSKEAGEGSVIRLQLLRWDVSVLARKHGEYANAPSAYGTSAAEFWQFVQAVCRGKQNALILSCNCGQTWPLLQFWEALEDGKIALQETREPVVHPALEEVQPLRPQGSASGANQGRGALHRLSQRGQGYLVFAANCHAAKFVFPGRAGTFRWLDTLNFGADFKSALYRGPWRNQSIANWLVNVNQMSEKYHLGALRNTAASQAMHAFKGHYMTETIYAHCNKQALDLEEASYYGGRCEAFRLGVVRDCAYHYDFRSLYPWVCVHHKLPVRLVGWWLANIDEDVVQDHEWHDCIARVHIVTDEACYPLRRGGTVIYPTGSFCTTLAGPELADAVKLGRVHRLFSYSRYEFSSALSCFADQIYLLRQEAERLNFPPLASWVKSMLVALPGKFGQRNIEWIDAPEIKTYMPYTAWWGSAPDGTPCRYRALASNVQREVNSGFAPDACPAIAAWITSAGRMRLLAALRAAGPESVHYCDTDSVIVDDMGRRNLLEAGLIRNADLGFLDLKAGPCNVEIRGIKYYIQDGQVKCSGATAEARADPASATEFWHERTEAEAIKAGERPSAMRTKSSYLRFAGYHHGEPQADGTVKPIHLEE